MKKHRFKKATSLLLAISMVAGMFSFNAFAATKDDTYIFEYTAWHQRSPHRFKETTADGLTYMPATYQIEGVAGSAAEGKTFVNYCCDLATSAVRGYLYKRVSIDEVTGNYYTKAEAERIRAIVAKGYHYSMESADIAALGKRATDAGYTVTNLTRGEALAATQHAVWVYGNSGGVTGATEVEKQYTQTMKPSTSNVASPIDYTYETHSDLQNKLIFTYPSGTKKYGNHSATTEANIENLKQYLLATATDKDVDVASLKGELVFSDKYFVKTYEADAVMSKGKYIVTLEFELENEVSNLDQLTLEAKQGSTTIYNGSISPTSVGTLTYDATNKTFALTFVTDDLDTAISLNMGGSQYLTKGVYRYESETKGGVDSQSFVGIGEGLTPVHAAKTIPMDGLEVENPSISTSVPVLGGKSATLVDEDEQRYAVTVAVPGEDPLLQHNEIILMLDASDSQGSNWTSVKESVMTIGEAVLPETMEDETRATMAVTLMGFGISGKTVLEDIFSLEDLESALEELPTADAFLNGQSATNCEVGFTHIEKYIESHQSKLKDAYVIYVSDSGANTSSEPVPFHNWPENQSWWYSYRTGDADVGREALVKFLFKGKSGHFHADGEFLRIMSGEDLVPATENIVGASRQSLLEAYLTKDMVSAEKAVVDTRLDELGDVGITDESDTSAVRGAIYAIEQDISVIEADILRIENEIAALGQDETDPPTEDGASDESSTDNSDTIAALTAELEEAKGKLKEKKDKLNSLITEKEELEEKASAWETVLARFVTEGEVTKYVYGNTTEAEEQALIDILAAKDTNALYEKFWADVMCKTIETTDLRTGTAVTWPVWRAWIDQLWSDVYDYSGLQYGNTSYPVEVVEAAFLKYDKDFSTFTGRWTENVAMSFYFTASMKYPYADSKNKGTPEYVGLRAAQACDALAAMDDVKEVYLIGYGSSSNDSWMNPWRATKYETKNYVQAENVCFYQSSSIKTIGEALKEIVPEIVLTIHSNVEITDYMSKWVHLDLDSIKIYKDDRVICRYIHDEETGTGTCEWTIPEEERPTAEVPIQVSVVGIDDYPDGGNDVIGNQNGDVYKIIWKVKDGTILVSDHYSLSYEVVMDVDEPGFELGSTYPTNGNTTATYDDPDGPKEEAITVPNVVTPEPKKYSVSFTKNVVVKDGCAAPEWPVNFSFTLTDPSTGLSFVSTHEFSSDGEHVVKFPAVLPGTYTLTENTLPDKWSSPFVSQTVVVEDEDVVLTANELKITNLYSGAALTPPEEEKYSVSFTKEAVVSAGSEQPSWPAVFTFNLTDISDAEKTHTITAAFTEEEEKTITFTDIPAGTYTLTETAQPENWSTTFTSETITVEDADVSIPAANLTITNTYNKVAAPTPPTPTTYAVSFTKSAAVASGSEQPAWPVSFTFVLTDTSDATKSFTKTVNFSEEGDKTVTFTDIPAGTYTLTESALPGNWSSAFTSETITVADADVSIPAADLTITNTYSKAAAPTPPTPTTYSVSFTKAVEVASGSQPAWPVSFTFVLTDTSDATKNFTKTTSFTAAGNETITFTDIPAGTYTLTESALPNKWSTQFRSEQISVVDSDVVLAPADLTITNTYNDPSESGGGDDPTPTPKYDISFLKKVVQAEGSTPIEYPVTFTFSLLNQAGRAIATDTVTFQSAGEAKVEFKNVRAGTYTIVEDEAGAGWTTDFNGYTVVVKNKDIDLSRDDLLVINTYNVPTQEEPPVILPPDGTEPPTETPPTEPTTTPDEPTTPPEENPTEPPEHSGAATTDTPIDVGAADNREHLPQTGMDWTTPLILAVLALGCFALSVIVRKKKKNS